MNNLKVQILLFIVSLLIFSSCKENVKSDTKNTVKDDVVAVQQKTISKKYYQHN